MRSPLGVFLGVLNAARTAVQVVLTGTSLTILRAAINTAAAGATTIIAAPGAGLRIYLIHISIQNTSAVDTTVIFLEGAVPWNGLGFLLSTRGSYVFDGPGGPGMAEIPLAVNTAFVVNLSGANQHSGFVLYRVGA